MHWRFLSNKGHQRVNFIDNFVFQWTSLPENSVFQRQVCVTSEPVLLMNFYGRLHIRIGSMIKMIALYDCDIWTLECEHVYSWKLYGDELCVTEMQMYWFVTINVLGGTTRQGHPMEGAGRWLPPLSSITLVSEVNLLWRIYCCAIWNACSSINYYEWLYVLWRIYHCIILNVIVMNVCMSIAKDQLLCYTKC
jgi:hypothetical protein